MSDTDRLLEFYRQYVGDPDRETDVYVGFAVFFLGIGLGAVGVVLFLWSARIGDPMTAYTVREVAAVAAAVGFPALLGSVVILLPVDRRMLYVTGVGGVLCLIAVALFVWAYPYNWNVSTTPDYSTTGVAIYSLGVVGVVAATGSALVAHHIERTEVAAGTAAGADTAEETAVSDEQVRSDIERELSDAELSWGGVEKREGRRLELDTSAVDDIEGNVDSSTATTTRSSGTNVDDAVQGLRGLQGGNAETDSGTGVDEQTSALRELREQKRAEEVSEEERLLDRFKRLLRID